EEMIPKVAEESLAEFCDVFCEEGVFTVNDARRILNEGKKYGLRPKIHADELVSFGGAELAAEVGAVSAEHLLCVSEDGIEAMAREGVIANLLPGTPFYLMLDNYAPAEKMLEAGVPVALATDLNPGTSATESLQMIMNLGSFMQKMTSEEIITGVTINAAYSVDRGDEIGSLEKGKLADIVIWDSKNIDFLIYHFGVNLANKVFKRGKLVAEGGQVLE
ncbi:MAG TPA: amidohydrolase family protein, partial [Tissierellales bacterium]|nr:amidohydrolase family protein [Tissierellales bacterium]